MTLMKVLAAATATLTALTLTACTEDSDEVSETTANPSVPAPDMTDLANDCATSPTANLPDGSSKWAPTEEWSVHQDDKSAVATGWYQVTGIGGHLAVTCNAEYRNTGWKVTSVKIEDPKVTADDLTADQMSALSTAYGDNFDPNGVYRLNGLCFGDVKRDDATSEEVAGAKVMCPNSVHLTDGDNAPATSSAPAKASFSDGTHMVGEDIQPGTYRNKGTSSCYWERLSGFGGTFADIIANENPRGQSYVTIDPSDRAFKSQNCGTWEMVE